jgi:hypothetical protein
VVVSAICAPLSTNHNRDLGKEEMATVLAKAFAGRHLSERFRATWTHNPTASAG